MFRKPFTKQRKYLSLENSVETCGLGDSLKGGPPVEASWMKSRISPV
jgi:hypothetical protein